MANKDLDYDKQHDDNLAVGAKGGAIAFSLKISSTALAFLNQILLARLLGASGIGEVILAVTVVRIIAQIAKFGMEETMMKFIPLYVDRNDSSRLKGIIYCALKFCLLFSTGLMLLALFFSKFIAIEVFNSEGLMKLMPVVVLSIPAWALRDVMGGILRGHKDAMRALIPESLIAPFFRIVIFLILLLKGASPLYAIIAFVSGEILSLIVSIIFLMGILKKIGHVQLQCDNKKILEVAYSIIFTSMGAMLYTQADIWILGMLAPIEIVGIYGVAAKLVLLVYFPMLAVLAVIPSLISSIYASGKLDELSIMVRESTRWILSIAMPIILILILEGKFILHYIYGSAFEAGYIILCILTIAQLIKASVGLVGTLMQMTGSHKFFMKINIIGGILNIILNVILVPRLGMLGAAISTAFCIVMIDIVCIYVLYRRLAIITLAKGIQFDLVFIAIVAIFYSIINYSNYSLGNHILLAVSLTAYIWKTIANHDIPWRLLTAKDKKD